MYALEDESRRLKQMPSRIRSKGFGYRNSSVASATRFGVFTRRGEPAKTTRRMRPFLRAQDAAAAVRGRDTHLRHPNRRWWRRGRRPGLVVAVVVAALFETAAHPAAQRGATNGEWRAYGGDVGSTHYSPLDQIDATNFSKLEVAWRFSPASLGDRPDFNMQATPLMVNGVLYLTAGSRRNVVALNATTGELLWMYRIDEGERAAAAVRRLSGRGVGYWTDGKGDDRIYFVTIGYQLVCLDAKTGHPVQSFGEKGIVDLKKQADQDIDLIKGEIAWNGSPVVARDLVVVGAAHAVNSPRELENDAKGYIRAFDVKTGKRRWIFHTIPQPGEYGNDTWLERSWATTGHTGVWAQFTVDEELGIVYLPVEIPTGDYVGVQRPGANLFGESLVALNLETGERMWHFQFVHHPLWDYDIPCAPILADVTIDGKVVKVVAQPSKQGWLYVFERQTGKPIWPIEERKVEQGTVPREWVLTDAAVRHQAAAIRAPGLDR